MGVTRLGSWDGGGPTPGGPPETPGWPPQPGGGSGNFSVGPNNTPALSTGVPWVFNVLDSQFGAVGDNSTDDTAAIQAAVNLAKNNGGTVYLPARHTYKITSPIYLGNNNKAYRITGGSAASWGVGGTPIVHLSGNPGNGTAGGAFQFCDVISGKSASGIELDHFMVCYDPASFTGNGTRLMRIAPVSNGAGDVQPFHIHHCAFAALDTQTGGHTPGPTASQPAPTGLTANVIPGGGSLPAGTYFFQITLTNLYNGQVASIEHIPGETKGSNEVSATVNTGDAISFSWATPPSSGIPLVNVNLYGATSSGGEATSPALVATTAATNTSLTLTTFTQSAGSVPSWNSCRNGCHSGIYMNEAILGVIDYCHFIGFINSIQYSQSSNSSYVNAVDVEHCSFNDPGAAYIAQHSVDCESCEWRDLNFENTPWNGCFFANGTANLYEPVITECLSGDFSARYTGAPGFPSFVNGLSTVSVHQGRISDCEVVGIGDNVNGVHLNAISGQWLIMGNAFIDGAYIYNNIPSAGATIVAIANAYNAHVAVYNNVGGNFRYCGIFQSGSGGALPIEDVTAIFSADHGMQIGGKFNAGGVLDQSDLASNRAQLALGSLSTTGTVITGANRGLVYTDYSTAVTGPTTMHLQAPGNATTNEVTLTGGTAGGHQLRASDNGLGFFGHTPGGRPTVTGSKGANAALASLMSALAGLGLVTDSTT